MFECKIFSCLLGLNYGKYFESVVKVHPDYLEFSPLCYNSKRKSVQFNSDKYITKGDIVITPGEQSKTLQNDCTFRIYKKSAQKEDVCILGSVDRNTIRFLSEAYEDFEEYFITDCGVGYIFDKKEEVFGDVQAPSSSEDEEDENRFREEEKKYKKEENKENVIEQPEEVAITVLSFFKSDIVELNVFKTYILIYKFLFRV